MKDILNSPFIKEISSVTDYMQHNGWHERNAGNISYILNEDELKDYLDLKAVKRTIPLTIDASEVADKIFLVTGTGKYFKNIKSDPELNLGIVKIGKDGKTAELLWGFSDGGKFTSEFSAHLLCHIKRLKVNPLNRVIMHSHPSKLVSMSYVHALNEREFSRTLWQMCIEAILVFPEGMGLLPWMLCGTDEIAKATADKMSEYKIVLWANHGVFSSGATLDEAFGLTETAEKAAEIFLNTRGSQIFNITSDSQIKALADFWNIKYRKEFLS